MLSANRLSPSNDWYGGERQVDEPTFDIDGERCPDVRVSHPRPRAVLPRLVAVLARLRDGVEPPDALARADIERLDVARRLALVYQPVADPIAHDHEIAVHDWR